VLKVTVKDALAALVRLSQTVMINSGSMLVR
jgi:hypothetical protein